MTCTRRGVSSRDRAEVLQGPLTVGAGSSVVWRPDESPPLPRTGSVPPDSALACSKQVSPRQAAGTLIGIARRTTGRGRSGLVFGFSAVNNPANRRHGVDNLVVQSSSTPVTNLAHTTQFRHQTRPAPPKTGLSPLGTSVAPANHA